MNANLKVKHISKEMLMNVSKITIILCSISLVGVIGKAQSFEHPGGLHSYKQIELARRNIASQKQPWTTAYEALIEQANRGLEKSYCSIILRH